MTVVLALLAAVSYGVGDFIGGLGGRRSHPALIPVAVQIVGVAAAVVAALTLGGTPTAHVWAWGALSGVGSGIGNVCLLRGLAVGRMSIVAPLSAVITAALPAVVGLLSGDRLAWFGWAGIVLALPAVALASSSPSGAGSRWTDVGYGLGAGLGFGILFVALDRAGPDAGGWPLLPGQAVALLIVLATAARPVIRLHRTRQPWKLGAVARWGGAAGLLGAGGNLGFLLATGTGQLTIAAVLASLYPAVTVTLAALVLHERIHRSQRAGLLAATVAILLIVTGG
ncbi:DMT family transporter [Actinoplanes sp. TBRC 11911]|uniref:DMT family transporter n=1 Tax=Actinoplanes sp. TBRC 11911 TaxID=2729386 RepID=UPI00145E3E7F|nr:DMT family transporter [Actinoplanes sp. TBRC 11911]NMO57374.1 DMT family transporter [Actinoplanes sp. TBRC 11911]